MNKEKQVVSLVADIGGTNIRIAQANKSNQLVDIITYQCAKFSSLFEVLHQYLYENQLLERESQLFEREIHACLAIACPTDDDWIAMTNLPWAFSQKSLKKELSLSSLTFINDYTAIAMAIPHLSEDQRVQIGTGQAKLNKAISVFGPGTGLGVATLIPIKKGDDYHWQCINSEGGHIDFAPVDDVEIAILQNLKSMKDRVSYEQLLSGYGLEQIYRALLSILNEEKFYSLELCAADISQKAVTSQCEMCELALKQFCKILGSFAGNLALLSNSQGGVFIAGGIVPRFIDYVKLSDFRLRFEAKGRLSAIPQKTPTYIITESQPGLLGASAYLNQIVSQTFKR